MLPIILMKNALEEKIKIKFFGLRAKTYSYLLGDGSEDKKAKSRKKCVMKSKCKLESYEKLFRSY